MNSRNRHKATPTNTLTTTLYAIIALVSFELRFNADSKSYSYVLADRFHVNSKSYSYYVLVFDR